MNYDTLIETEDLLLEKLTRQSRVDGHDVGSGEMNIFILTDDPFESFNEVKSVLGGREVWVDVRAAYRDVSRSEYAILWPKDLSQFEVA